MSEHTQKRPSVQTDIKELVLGRRYRLTEQIALAGQLREARFEDRRLDDDQPAPSPYSR